MIVVHQSWWGISLDGISVFGISVIVGHVMGHISQSVITDCYFLQG